MDEFPQYRGTLPDAPGLRPLSPRERGRVLSRLRRKWPPGDRGWWHPYDAFPDSSDVLCVQSSWLASVLPRAEFRRRAAFHWSSYWVLGESSPGWDTPRASYQGDFEISNAYLQPVLAGEMLVTPRNLSWLAYTDHEEATYLRGAWLIKTVKELWSAWERHVWKSPVHDRPPLDEADNRPWWELR